MIKGYEMGKLLGHDRYRWHADASRAAGILGLPLVRPGGRREFTEGQAVAVVLVAGLRGPMRTAILTVVPDLVDHEQARWIAMVPAGDGARIGWGREPGEALGDLGDWDRHAHLVHMVDVHAALTLIADRLDRSVTVDAP